MQIELGRSLLGNSAGHISVKRELKSHEPMKSPMHNMTAIVVLLGEDGRWCFMLISSQMIHSILDILNKGSEIFHPARKIRKTREGIKGRLIKTQEVNYSVALGSP